MELEVYFWITYTNSFINYKVPNPEYNYNSGTSFSGHFRTKTKSQ